MKTTRNLLALIGLTLIILIIQYSCKEEDDAVIDPNKKFVEYETSSGEIGAGGGSITINDPNSSINGASVIIPEGALNSLITVSIEYNNLLKPAIDTTAIVVSFKPEGTQFSKPVTITLPFEGDNEPTVYYYNEDEELLEQLPVIEFNQSTGIVTTETDHFSDFFTSKHHVYIDVHMFNINNKGKCKVQFWGYANGNKYGLAGVPLKLTPFIFGGLQYWSVLGFLEKANTIGTLNSNCYTTIEVELRRDQFIGSEFIESHVYTIRRRGPEEGNYYAEVYKQDESGVFQSIHCTNILSQDGIDQFFSGEAIVINFDKELQSSKEYFIKTSFVLSENFNGYGAPVGTRFSPKYSISTQKEENGLLSISDMSSVDPDIDNNGIDDEYEIQVNTPTITTTNASSIDETSAILGGNITSDGGADVTERGVYYGTLTNPESTGTKVQIGTGTGNFSQTIIGLVPNTTYYVKAYAINNYGTSYGEEVNFITNNVNTGEPCPGTPTVIDYDGNMYLTVLIGDQCWMKDNLAVKHYENGEAITLGPSEETIPVTSKYYFVWGDENEEEYSEKYGLLYTWAAAMNGESDSNSNPSSIQGICPDGWHLPSDEEWKELELFLGMDASELDNTGERGTDISSQLRSDGSSGFDADFAGWHESKTEWPQDWGKDQAVLYWTTSSYDNSNAWIRFILYEEDFIIREKNNKSFGFSVRCIKD